jgi:hypothetical protein
MTTSTLCGQGKHAACADVSTEACECDCHPSIAIEIVSDVCVCGEWVNSRKPHLLRTSVDGSMRLIHRECRT